MAEGKPTRTEDKSAGPPAARAPEAARQQDDTDTSPALRAAGDDRLRRGPKTVLLPPQLRQNEHRLLR